MVVLVRASTASGQIVGQYQDSSGTHGFLCGGGANGSYTVIDPPGSVGTEPTSINASGQIAGWYVDSSNNPVHGFLATANPVEHWVNTAGGNWSTAANWNPGVPTATLNADIDAPGVYSVAITTAAIAYGLLVNDAQATVTDNKGSFNSVRLGRHKRRAHRQGWYVVLNGGALNAGTIFIDSGGTLQIAKGTYALSETITDNGSLIDNTTATITGNISGTGTILAANTAYLTINGNLTGSENFSLTNSAHVFNLHRRQQQRHRLLHNCQQRGPGIRCWRYCAHYFRKRLQRHGQV